MLSYSLTILGTALPVLNGGTGVTTSTGTGSNVLAVNPSFTGTSNGFTSTTSAANGSCTFVGAEGGGLIIQSTGATNSSIVDIVNVSSAGQFSTGSAAGDFVLRTRTARALHFQSGNLAPAMTITTSNTVNVLTTLTASGGLVAASPTFTGTSNFANISATGNLTVTAQLRNANITMYVMSSDSGWPNGADSSPQNWVEVATSGSKFTYTGGGIFQNTTGRQCFTTVVWTTRRVSNPFGADTIWIRETGTAIKHGSVKTGGTSWMTTTGVMLIQSGNSFVLEGFQDSGSGNNWQATDTRLSIRLNYLQ